MLEIAHLHERAGTMILPAGCAEAAAPQLAPIRPGARGELISSISALLRGPASPKRFDGGPYFRDCWIDQKFPTLAFLAAILIQALLVIFPPPVWNVRPSRTVGLPSRTELTWYGPVNDLPLLLPSAPAPKPTPRRETSKTPPTAGADAFHPRQTILSAPLHPTHPRQVLIQPKAPQEPPKILPDLPNIVQLARAEPARPKLHLTQADLASMRAKAPSASSLSVAAPEILPVETQTGPINIASSAATLRRPALPVNPMSAPRAAQQRTDADAAAPEISARSGANETVIALSANPAPVAPPPAMPGGNLSARVSISPDGVQRGTPGAAGTGMGTATTGTGGGSGKGPDGIFITGGAGNASSAVSGLSVSPSLHAGGNSLPSRPALRPRLPDGPKSLSGDAETAAKSVPKLGMDPHEVLGSKRVYTLHVNMPNLTSASGSWILNFAELEESEHAAPAGAATSDVAGPVPVRKVDPKYPPELRALHVDGEVVLYAIIRKDGSVDSIQLVHSADPQLDANAMEALAQWKFVPAEKRGEPIDLEAVVHIPFRSRGPAF